MKKILAIAISFAAITLSGCVRDEVVPFKSSEVRVTSTIDATRASIDEFQNGCEIGIYKLPAGEAFASAHRANARYVYSGDGGFAPFSDDHKMMWQPTAVDFVAYYPYVAGVEADHIYRIDATQQVDLLYSEKVAGKTEGTVDFTFHHALAKVNFVVTNENPDLSLEGMTAVVKGMNTVAGFDLATGVLGAASVPADIAATLDNPASLHAIVLPGTGVDFTVEFTVEGETVTVPAYTGKTFEADKQYTFPVTFKANQDGPIAVVVGDATIHPWEDGGTEPNVDVEVVGDGQQEAPVIDDEDFISDLPEDDAPVAAQGGEYFLTFEITNPLPGVNVEPTVSEGAEGWIIATVAPATRATAEVSVDIEVKANDTAEARTGTLDIVYNDVVLKSITISQEAGEPGEEQTVVFDFTAIEGISETIDGISVAFAKDSDGSTNPTYNSTASEIRMYVKNYLTISGGEHTITGVNVTIKATDKCNPITLASGGGEWVSPDWVGESNEIELTTRVGSATGGHHKITAVTVTYK
ncbi:MAG: fimbrillin family protein [Alistipes sp.]|jgi:hypothetical protein|nr:fimbrillin family protein [Alistipes sp.]